MPTAASLQEGLFGVFIYPCLALYGLFKPCAQHSRLYLLHICIYMRASILTAFQAAHFLLRLQEAEDKVRDVISCKNCGIIVGNTAVIVSTTPAKEWFGLNFENINGTVCIALLKILNHRTWLPMAWCHSVKSDTLGMISEARTVGEWHTQKENAAHKGYTVLG